jgi:hypothetical protein
MAFFLCCLLASPEALLRQFADMAALEVRFVETKTVALLVQPLQSEGVLRYARGVGLTRTIETPYPSEVEVTRTRLRMRQEGKTQEIDLGAHPAIRLLVTSLLDVLSGDAAALQAAYLMEYTPGWTLTLRPKDEMLAKLITLLRFQGEGVRVRRLEVHESNGDTTRTEFR